MNEGNLTKTFDTVRLSAGTVSNEADWMSAGEFSRGWTVRPAKNGSLQLLRGGVPRGTVEIAPQVPGLDEGKPRCYCWLADAAGQPLRDRRGHRYSGQRLRLPTGRAGAVPHPAALPRS